jgi:hypothetical protein
MKLFKLKETTVTVRGVSVRVREITHAERLQWVKVAQEDRFRGPALLVSLGALDPTMTEDEAGSAPADVVEELSLAIMKMSGMKTEKESNAGGAVQVPSESGVGNPAK